MAAPNDPSAAILAQCTPGPIAVNPSLSALSLLFHCPQKGEIRDIATQGSFVYAAFSSTELVRVASTGGAPELLAYDPTPGVQVSRFVVGSPQIFYVAERLDKNPSEQELRMIASPGTPPVIVTRFGADMGVLGIAQDASEVYLSVLTDTKTRLGKVIAIHKTSLVQRELVQGVQDPEGIVVDATHAYVASWGVGIVRVPLEGGALETTLPANAVRFGGIALDASSVYALDRGTYPAENDGRFLKAPKSGGAPSAFGTVIHGHGPLLDGADLIVSAGAPPLPSDPGADLRPLRYAPDGTMTELVSPTLAQVAGTSLAADTSALYFGSPQAVARLAR